MTGRILIADDLATNRIVLKVKLTVSCYDVIQADRTGDVIELARRSQPDLIILGRCHDADGLEICRQLKQDPVLFTIPIIKMTEDNSQKTQLDALIAGADEVYTRHFDEATFLAMVRNLIRARGTYDEVLRRKELSREFGCAESAGGFDRQARIALIAPDPETGILWRMHLATETRHKIDIMTKSQALEDLGALGKIPDAFVIGSTLEETSDGLRLLSELRARLTTRHAVIVVQDGGETPSPSSMALDLGANAVTGPKFDARVLSTRLHKLLQRKFETDAMRESFDHSLAMALRDPLTGLHNRRYAQGYLERLEREEQATGQAYALLLLDLDRFKSINDRFGHMVGDEVLVEVANRLRDNMRDMDLLARFGGEEFLVALPGLGVDQVEFMAERLRRAVGEFPVHARTIGRDIAVTVSIGVAIGTPSRQGDLSAHSLLQSADQALYRSKSDGRNQVTYVKSAA